MISSFNLSELQSLLKDFYTLTQIKIVIYDENFNLLAAYPEGMSDFCTLIHEDPSGAKACKQCNKRAFETALCQNFPYTYLCHAGLTESVIPLQIHNITVGYLLFGQIFSYENHESGWEKIRELCSNFQIDMTKLKSAVYQKPLTSKDYIQAASHISEAIVAYLCMERLIDLQKEPLPVRIEQYIKTHFTEKLDAAGICEHFYIGRSQLYDISKQNFKMPIAKYIRHLRIEKAKQLLEHSDLSLAEIASECGFEDYNYFITVFRQLVGIPPKKYVSGIVTKTP